MTDFERSCCPICGDPDCTFQPACRDAIGVWPERSYPHHDTNPTPERETQ